MIPDLKSYGAYAERLMVEAAVWRKQTTTDAGGGQGTSWVDQVRTVKVQMVSPTAQERQAAAQEGVEITHTAVLPTNANIARGDRLVIGTDDPYELLSDPLTATHSAVARATAKQEPWDEPTT